MGTQLRFVYRTLVLAVVCRAIGVGAGAIVVACSAARPGGAAALPSGTAAPTGGTAALTDDPAGKPVSHALVSQGYRPTIYRGQLFYCRSEKLTGSQFSHKVCLSEHEAALQERVAQDEMMKRGFSRCLPPLRCDK